MEPAKAVEPVGRPDPEYAGPVALDHLELALQDAIEESGLVMYWHSAASAKSVWVRQEFALADQHDVPMLVMRLDDLPLPPPLQGWPELRWPRLTVSENLALSVIGPGAQAPASCRVRGQLADGRAEGLLRGSLGTHSLYGNLPIVN